MSLFSKVELFFGALLISIETACMYFIYIVIALYFPSEFDMNPVQIGGCYALIGICYLLFGLLGISIYNYFFLIYN